MKEQYKELSAKILKYAKPLSIVAIFVCFLIAAYSMQTQQASDLNNANKRISDLEFDRTIAEKQLKGDTQSTNSPTVPLLTIKVTAGMVLNKVPNKNYNPSYPSGERLVFPDIGLPYVPQELLGENSVIAVIYNFYVVFPIPIDSVQLSIDNKTIESAPLFFKEARPEFLNWPNLWLLYFKYEGIIKSGHYSNAKIIVVSDNTTFISNPFEITIPE